MKRKQILFTILFVALNAAFTALTIKASIGVSTLDAMNLSISEVTHIKVGTIGVLFNLVVFMVELILLGKRVKLKHFIQLVPVFIFGTVLNFFFYQVFRFNIDNYYIAIITFILSVFCISFVVGATILLNVTTYPLEGMCMALSEKIPLSFRFLRQSFDILSISIAIILTILYHQQWTIREGTILFSLIYTQTLHYAMKIERHYFQKWHLIT